MQQLKVKYNQPFDTTTLNQDCKHLFQKVGDEIGFYDSIAKKMPNAVVESFYTGKRIRRNQASLLALSFLPEDHALAVQINQIARASYQTLHPELEVALEQFIDKGGRPDTDKEDLPLKEFIAISDVYNKFLSEIEAINVKLIAGQTKISLKKLVIAAETLANCVKIEQQAQANRELIETIRKLIDLNAKKLPFKDGKTVKEQQQKTQEFITYTKDFRDHIKDYATLYLNITDEKQKDDFKRFINIVHTIDKDIISGNIPTDLSLFDAAFEHFEKITDPAYHRLSEQQIITLQWKKSTWEWLNFVSSITIIISIALIIIQPWIVFVPVLALGLILAIPTGLTKTPLYDVPKTELEKNEQSKARTIFKYGYSTQVSSLFQPPTQNTLESKPEKPKTLEIGANAY